MNLMKFKGADDAVKLTIRLSAGYCIILTIAFASSIIFLINKIEKAYGQALVIDRPVCQRYAAIRIHEPCKDLRNPLVCL